MATKSEEDNTAERKNVEYAKRCRICKEEEETLEHVIERCHERGPESRRSAEGDRGRTRRDEENIEGKKKEKQTEEVNEQIEGRKAEGAGGIDIGRRRKD